MEFKVHSYSKDSDLKCRRKKVKMKNNKSDQLYKFYQSTTTNQLKFDLNTAYSTNELKTDYYNNQYHKDILKNKAISWGYKLYAPTKQIDTGIKCRKSK